MSNFSPNLPIDDIKLVVMSTINKKIKDRVEALGIRVISTETLPMLLPFEQTHADMQFFHFSKDTLFILKECEYNSFNFKNHFKKIIICEKEIGLKYPDNVLLNAVSIVDKIICNPNTIDSTILKLVNENNFKILKTKQGYTKCSTCIVSKNAIITSDKSIQKASKEYFDVLLIEPGNIDLPGTNYGFIGGCSFKLNKSTLAFTGNIKLHPNFEKIKSFCRNHNVYLQSLTNENLLDIGSIIPIL
ncbi:MAG: hypothetical protein IJV39_00305 [Ruminococcus sp.]|nr:hypothetical protein [Ruminococcus sp.]